MSAIQFGAIDCETGLYTRPRDASKRKKYICPDKSCKKPVIFKSGDINAPHFSHYPEDTCFFYKYHDSESSNHLHVKEVVKYLINDSRISNIIRKCNCCGITNKEKFAYFNNGFVETEKRMEFNGCTIIPDVSYFDGECNLKYIIEICHTHKTKTEKRPDPWCEIDTSQFILDLENVQDLLDLNSISTYFCDNCKNKQTRSIIVELSTKGCKECEGFGIFKDSKIDPKLCINCTCCYNKYPEDNTCCETCVFLFERAKEYTGLLKKLKEVNTLCKELKIPRKNLEKAYHISYTNINNWNPTLYLTTLKKIEQDIIELTTNKCRNK